MNIKTHEINLIVGDWSNDGHGHKDRVTISCNVNCETLQEYYKKGTEIFGIDIVDKVCSDYQDSYIKDETLGKLRALGIIEDRMVEDDECWIQDEYEWVEIYMGICKLADKNLDFEVVKQRDTKIEIGGYGLYSN